MTIRCPQCGTKTDNANLNISTALAKCDRCSHVFGFADQVPGSAASKSKQPVSLPKGFDVSHDGFAFQIKRRWFSFVHVALLFFCCVWDGALVFFYLQAFSKPTPLIAFLFPLIHVTVGVLLTYSTVAGLVNSTSVRIDHDNITVRHGPMPWPGNRTIPRVEVRQFFCDEKIIQSKNGQRTVYAVRVKRQDGKDKKLVGGLERLEQARFIEQELEKYLGIKDERMENEA